ncbi:MAG TPA: 2-hydroxyglutaryl-CoA dehydratase, partial [Armatimonadetes bacterium]|nr:2-hydroxyglutaryl-CoA dehydratase [Armatimonadota bacterium]
MAYFIGIDVGSLTCDIVMLDGAGELIAVEILPTGARMRATVERAFSTLLERVGITYDDVTSIIATGYGRNIVTPRTRTVTEITCHARGALHLFPNTRLVIDVGGQDSKAIRVSNDGQVVDFVMNDKCAAGTGRFFEVMARALEIDLDDFGATALRSDNPVKLSSVCTVFAESEVVSLLAQGERIENIAAGLCWAAAERAKALAQRVGVTEEVTVTGGVAKNTGFVRALQQLLDTNLNVPDEPQI